MLESLVREKKWKQLLKMRAFSKMSAEIKIADINVINNQLNIRVEFFASYYSDPHASLATI